MSILAHEGPLETNIQPDLQLVPDPGMGILEQPEATVIAFPSTETAQQAESEKSQQLIQALETLMFQDTNILTTELQELGFFIEDLEGENEGLGILVDLDNGHLQHLRVDYSSEEDAITRVTLGDYWYRGDGGILDEQNFDWAPGIEPADEITIAAEIVLAKVNQARSNKHEEMRRSAQTYGRLVMERARQINKG